MNTEQVRAMSDEGIRIKIAELCGWTHERLDPKRDNAVWCAHWYPPKTTEGDDGDTWWRSFGAVPNYPFDLNAMHDALTMLNEEQRFRYGRYFIRDTEKISLMEWSFYLHNATARQRAEAFVVTMEGT